MGDIDGISYQRHQVMMAQLLQKHWEWREDRRPMMRHGSVIRPTMYLARSWTSRQDVSLQPQCVKWLDRKDKPLSTALRINSLLRDAFAKGPSRPCGFG